MTLRALRMPTYRLQTIIRMLRVLTAWLQEAVRLLRVLPVSITKVPPGAWRLLCNGYKMPSECSDMPEKSIKNIRCSQIYEQLFDFSIQNIRETYSQSHADSLNVHTSLNTRSSPPQREPCFEDSTEPCDFSLNQELLAVLYLYSSLTVRAHTTRCV